jgi:hypothetical protein
MGVEEIIFNPQNGNETLSDISLNHPVIVAIYLALKLTLKLYLFSQTPE